MTSLIDRPATVFAGKVYMTESMDQLGTFDQAWQEFEAAGHFAALDALTDQPNRTALLMFSPYGAFQYWIGSLLPAGTAAPAGLEAVQLPAATVGEVSEKADSVLANFPVETMFSRGLERLEKAGFPLPEHIGQTDNPYYLESYQLTEGKITAVKHLLFISMDQLKGYDEWD
ncbi:hypothetical protein [Lacticaseibacillus yichunensis]|uniref:GyrI-like small molecule binding domain-containing protein n=1 Tax=Lacticaseibacillus yichunensis TaxID=2486015 RepID=A0ABW4CN46_9LACO|nr:hypothetical protein [Lacticaseibacillus yichunensis]